MKKLFAIIIALFLWSSSTKIVAQTSTEVGKTAGKLDISLTGSATYTVPIAVPPGINGVEPRLAISYNSQTSVGIAGYGWNISGLSAIIRIPSTKFHDGINDPVDYDSLDRLALDGQRLILKTGIYGQAGSTYSTENFSNVKISLTSYNTTRQNTENGITENIQVGLTFKVEYPDGSVAYYGATPDSNNYNTSAITSWENPQGVKINYNYINSNFHLYIKSIKYGGSLNTAPSNEVQFIYKNRINPEQAYQYEFFIYNDKILSEIKVVSNAVGYRNYMLTHNTSTSYERLTQIQEKSGDGLKSLNPISFTYENQVGDQKITFLGKKNFSLNGSTAMIPLYTPHILGDFDGNGELDIMVNRKREPSGVINDLFLNVDENTTGAIQGTSTPYLDTESNNSFAFEALDYNMPGNKKAIKQSWCIFERSYDKLKFKIYSKSPTNGFELIETKEINNDCICGNFLTGDFNGDGLMDVIGHSTPYESVGFSFIDLNNRANTNIGKNLGAVRCLDSYKHNDEVVVRSGDINGDHKTDIIIYSTNSGNPKISVYTMDDSSTSLKKLFDFNYNFNLYLNSPYPNYPNFEIRKRSIHEADFNGDGKIDILFTAAARVILYSTGNGFVIENLDSNIPMEDENTTILTYDINSDGKVDIISTSKIRNYIGDESYTYAGTFYLDAYGVLHENPGPTVIRKVYTINIEIKSFIKSGVTGVNSTVWSTNQLSFPTGNIEKMEGSYILFNNSYPPIFIKPSKKFTENILAICEPQTNSLYIFNISKLSNEKLLLNVSNNNIVENITYSNLKDTNIYNSAGQIENYPNYDIPNTSTIKIVSKITVTNSSNSTTKSQQFKYYGGVNNIDGLGFLGFRGVARSNWYNDASQITTTVTKFDMSKRGAPKESFTMLGDIAPNYTLTPTDSYISRSLISYNNEETGTLTPPLLADKTYKLFKTKEVVYNGLTNTSSETSLQYTPNNNPQTITQITKNGSTIEQTVTSTMGYDASTAPYMVDRPKSKNVTIVTPTDTTTSEELYSVYDGNLLKEIKKKGNGTNYITENNDYDAYGNIIKKTLTAVGLAPRISSFDYDASKRFITKKTDIEGLETTYAYDQNNGWVLSETLPSNSSSPIKTSFEYDVWGKLIKKTDYLGKNETYIYNNTSEGGITKTSMHDDGKYEYGHCRCMGKRN